MADALVDGYQQDERGVWHAVVDGREVACGPDKAIVVAAYDWHKDQRAVVDPKQLQPGTVIRHRTGGNAFLSHRKEDDSGWWMTDGSGLHDRVWQDGDWTVMPGHRYRKKPVVIEAIRYRGDEDKQLVRAFVTTPIDECGAFEGQQRGLHLETLEGWIHVSPGDWIIKGVAGEFYPCKPEIFDASYEAVE